MTFSEFKKLLLFLLTAFLGNASIAQQQDEFVSRDVSERLKPASQGKTIKAWILTLTTEDRNTTIAATSERPFSVFFGETMLNSGVQNLRWDIDSLNQVLGQPNQLTFFSSHSSPVQLTQITRVVPDPLNPQLRKKNAEMNFAVIVGSILLLFLSVIPGALFGAIMGIGKLFSINLRDDRTEELRSNSAPAILSGLFTLLFSSIVTTFLMGSDLPDSRAWFYAGLVNFFVLMLVFLLRYLIIFFVSWIFKMGEVFDHQMNGFFRFALLLCLISGGAMVMDFLTVGRLNFSVLALDFLIPILVATYYLTLFLRLHRSTSLRPLHLFSYLCLSEFIPLVLLVFTL